VDFFDRYGRTLQIVGTVYLALMLILRTSDYGSFGLVVVVDVFLAPLGILAMIFIVVPLARGQRF